MIVAIDGPAGAGKSTIAKALAKRLGFRHLDTGSTYRAVTLAVLRSGVDLNNALDVEQVAAQATIELRNQRIFLNQQDVTDAIHDSDVDGNIYVVADNPRIRERLVSLQREFAGEDAIVTEGRDQGTVAFPNAKCKIYLTASPEERARRRARQRKIPTNQFDSVLAEMNERDQRDFNRPVGALKQADDAVVVNTDGKEFDQVLDELESIVQAKMGN